MYANPFPRQAVVRATRLRAGDPPAKEPTPWSFASLAGRLCELSEEGSAGALTVACSILAEAQGAGEPVAWITHGPSLFHPPDLTRLGIDLKSIAILRLPSAHAALLAADWLLRSNAFGLLVVDVGREWRIADGELGRLARLAARGVSAVLFLTRKRAEEESIGSMISLRAEVRSRVAVPQSDRLVAVREDIPRVVEIRTLKDKRGAPRGSVRRRLDGAARMC